MIDSRKSEREQVLEKVRNAGQKKDAGEFLMALTESKLPNAYFVAFKNRFSTMAEDDVRDEIGAASDELYVSISSGRKVFSISSYFWKIIENRLKRRMDLEKRMIRGEPVERVELKGGISSDEDEAKLGDLREKAISLLRDLIPRLGQQHVQEVMRYVLGSMENGAQDVSSTEIGEALGLEPATVRKCVQRGFQRIAKIVKEENLAPAGFDPSIFDHGSYVIGSIEEAEEEQDLWSQRN
jgi:DNA-directed RNA polymerase specialized sigma24 family protein